jgi:hypothetical protein
MKSVSVILTMIVCMVAAVSAQNWTKTNPLPADYDLTGVTYGNGTYVFVGTSNGSMPGYKILTSTDAVSWAGQSGGAYGLNGVAYGGSNFVAVGTIGVVVTSSNAQTWTPGTSNSTRNLASVVYGNNRFVAVGDSGTILTSANGSSWTARTSGTQQNLFSVTFGKGIFVAVGDSGRILTSDSGVTWTPQTSGIYPDYAYALYTVGFVGNQFVACGGGYIAVSANGTSWTVSQLDLLVYGNELKGIAFGNNTYVIVGGQKGNIYNEFITYSSDCQNWNYEWYGGPILTTVMYANNKFIAGGATGDIYTSSDGVIWVSTTPQTNDELIDVAFGDSLFVAVGRVILSSTDGVNWTSRTMGTVFPTVTNKLRGVVYGGSQFVSVGDSGLILSSADGISWTNRLSGTSLPLNCVAWANNTFVAVGGEGVILSSSNGTTWTIRTSGTVQNFYSVTYGNNKFVATGDSGYILTSQNGASWSKQASNTDYQINSVTFGNGKFAALVYGGMDTILLSSDGSLWTKHYLQGSSGLQKIRFADSTFIFGNGGVIYISHDAVAWTAPYYYQGNLCSTNGLSFAYGKNIFVAAGSGGTLFNSNPQAPVKRPFAGAVPSVYAGDMIISGRSIDYALSSASQVTLRMYTLSGRLICQLVNRVQQAGAYSVPIPEKLLPGTYMAVFKTDSRIVARTFIVR